jgi:hypothetical protein
MSDYDWSADDLALISGQYPPGPPCSPDVGQDMIRIVERWVQLDRDPLLTKP